MTGATANVFSDLGFSPAEAENLRVRSAMMRALISYIRERKLTARRAAKLFRVSPPRASALIHGHIEHFSADDLILLLANAGLRIDVRVRKVV